MSKLSNALIVIICVDMLLILGGFAMHNLNSEQTGLISYDDSLLGKYDSGGYVLNTSDYNDYLPPDEGSVSGTGNIFTDTFKSARSWFSSGKNAINTAGILLFGPGIYLHAMNLPLQVVFAVSTLWFLTTLLLIVSWILGRNV